MRKEYATEAARFVAIRNTRLSQTQKWVLSVLNRYIGDNDQCWPSQFRLCDMCSLSASGLKKVLAQLKRLGLLIVRRTQTTNRYSLVEPRLKELETAAERARAQEAAERELAELQSSEASTPTKPPAGAPLTPIPEATSKPSKGHDVAIRGPRRDPKHVHVITNHSKNTHVPDANSKSDKPQESQSRKLRPPAGKHQLEFCWRDLRDEDVHEIVKNADVSRFKAMDAVGCRVFGWQDGAHSQLIRFSLFHSAVRKSRRDGNSAAALLKAGLRRNQVETAEKHSFSVDLEWARKVYVGDQAPPKRDPVTPGFRLNSVTDDNLII